MPPAMPFAGVVRTAMTRWMLLIAICFMQVAGPKAGASTVGNLSVRECVVLLHGLARVSNSMGELEEKLARAGYFAVNISYPSRSFAIDILATDAVGRGISSCRDHNTPVIHFVTHSLGGILLRYFQQHFGIPELGRVVMLGPPNQGSPLVDNLLPIPGFGFITGPTGSALGTQSEVLAELDPVNFDLGVIAGTSNINPLNFLFFSEPNDTIVSVDSTKVDGMRAHIVLPVTHTFMMRNDAVIDHTIHYLKTGAFMPLPAE